MECTLCPRRCRADRENTYGICKEGKSLRIARAALHPWEEPCISGERGAGAIFFTGCSLHCVYCQNREISAGSMNPHRPGKEVDIDGLVRIFFGLCEQGAHNINLVTGDHFIPQIAEAINKARSEGFNKPFIFNCSGYETVESLKLLRGLIDIYLPDLKYLQKDLAKAFSGAEDYPEAAKAALSEMVRQQPECIFDEKGLLKRGVLVRNLLLPGHITNSKQVLRYLHETYGDRIMISILSQYTPLEDIPDDFPELKRRVKRSEYRKLTDYALRLGIENAYIQELSASAADFIPEFDSSGI